MFALLAAVEAFLGRAGLGEAMLAQDQTPEAVCDLIATLADMNAQNFSHGCSSNCLFGYLDDFDTECSD
jgi:hypothetical protein